MKLHSTLCAMPKEEIEAIHSATLDILSNVGIKFPNNEALDALADVGAVIDRKQMIARFSDTALHKALRRAPREVTLCAGYGGHARWRSALFGLKEFRSLSLCYIDLCALHCGGMGRWSR